MLKNQLEREKGKLAEKQEEHNKILREMTAIKKEITRLEWRIEECSPTIKMEIYKRSIKDIGYDWIKIEREIYRDDQIIEVTRRNALEIIRGLQKLVDEINNVPYHKAKIFAEHNESEIVKIYNDIGKIKKKFGFEEE